MPVHAPPEFRYFGFAVDFPAKPALEYVLCHFINLKRDAMVKSAISDALVDVGLALLEQSDGATEIDGAYPNLDTWLRFNFSHADFVSRASDKALAAEYPRFEILQLDDSEWGVDDAGGIGSQWVCVKAPIVFDYSSAALTLRFTQDVIDQSVDCLCWVTYAEGDGDDVSAIAAALGQGE